MPCFGSGFNPRFRSKAPNATTVYMARDVPLYSGVRLLKGVETRNLIANFCVLSWFAFSSGWLLGSVLARCNESWSRSHAPANGEHILRQTGK